MIGRWIELTVRPLQLGATGCCGRLRSAARLLSQFEFEPVSREILLQAAGLRAGHRLRTPDAIQLATGLRVGATLPSQTMKHGATCHPSRLDSVGPDRLIHVLSEVESQEVGGLAPVVHTTAKKSSVTADD